MKPKLIVFDMDGVLVDVSASYREAVRQTAILFFSRSEGFVDLPEVLFPLEDLALLKQSGGLNNDWDLTAQVLSLLCTQVPPGPVESSGPAAAGLPRFDVRRLAAYLRSTPLPLTELMNRHGRIRDPRIDVLYGGDVSDGNLIKGLFQEIYLGPDLFSKVYGRNPGSWKKAGLIETERLLLEPALLEDLARSHLLAIATGRPKVEAEVPLVRFSVRDLFLQLFTLDDCLAAEAEVYAKRGEQVSLSKPHPFMLDEIARLMAGRFGEFLYLGDMPDDMETASSSAAGYQGIGVLWSAPDRKQARQALLAGGACQILSDPAELASLVAHD